MPAYIKALAKQGNSPISIYHNICNIYGNNEVSFATISKWIHELKYRHESIKDACNVG